MYIDKNLKRINPHATIEVDGIVYHGNILKFSRAIASLGIQEIPDPERKNPEYYITTEQDTPPYVVNTPRDLDAIKESIWNKIKDKRELLQVSGVKVGDHWYPNDIKSRTQWERMRSKAQVMVDSGISTDSPYNILDNQVVWKTMTNDFVPLTLDLIIQITDAIEVQESVIFYISIQKDEEMRGIENLEDLIEWEQTQLNSGWPEVFEEVIS